MIRDTIFSKIIKREIPATIIAETDEALAFKDVNPEAPVHILFIPKKPLSDLSEAGEDDAKLLGGMLLMAASIAKAQGIDADGYRVVINKGERAGQSVFHLHMHLLGGRAFAWPPG